MRCPKNSVQALGHGSMTACPPAIPLLLWPLLVDVCALLSLLCPQTPLLPGAPRDTDATP